MRLARRPPAAAANVPTLAPPPRHSSPDVLPDRSGRRWLLGSPDAVLLAAVLGLVAVHGVLWLYSIPFQHGPDEGAHFQVVRFIRDYGRLPRFHPDELWLIKTQSGAVETYAAFPPLAYVVAALATLPIREQSMWAARAASLLACLGAVGLTFLLARQLMPAAPRVAVTAALVVGFLPQLAFTAAYVNNDALAVFLSALLCYLLARVWRGRPTIPAYLAIGLTIGALLLTKYTVYAAAAVGFAVALGLLVVQRWREGERQARPTGCHPERSEGSPGTRDAATDAQGVLPGVLHGERSFAALRMTSSWHVAHPWVCALALVTTVLATAGWWFVRNWQIYGELIPSKTVAAAKAAAGGNTLYTPADHGVTLLTVSTQTDFWAVTLRSFVATFGYLSIYLDDGYYLACLALVGLGAVGLALRLRRHGIGRDGLMVAAVAVALAAGTVLSAMAISAYGEYSPQGRYLFAILPALAIALAVGWHELGVRSAVLRWIPGAAVLGLVALSGVSLLGYVVPRDYGNPVEKVLIELDRPAGPQSATAEVEVLGWSFAQGGTEWRPLEPTVVDEYRRPVSGILIYLDGPPGQGAFQGAAHYGFRRRDVGEFYGGNRRLDPIGYRYVFPPGALGPGSHRLYACAVVPTTPVPTCAERGVEIGPAS